MRLQSVRSRTVTSAISSAAFRPASAPADGGRDALSRLTDLSREFAPELSFSIHSDFGAVETEWRSFQEGAECTPFQAFEWQSAWYRHVGAAAGIVPAIVVGRFATGKTAFILPLAVQPRRFGKRLCWLAEELCDYNAPLLAREFSHQVTRDRFLAFWSELQRRMQADPRLAHDWIEFEKMPETIGAQINPFNYLPVAANANSAHITQLGDEWEAFYRAKRSSATRRRDRAKRKHMAEFGEIHFVTVTEPAAARQTLDTLWEQKKQIFARRGIADIFARPGYREFFADFASNPQTRHLVHISREEIGGTCAATNFAVIFGDCYYHLLSSYCDDRLTRYGPGVLHLRDLMAYAIKAGLRRFDFTIGDEGYKLEWSDLRLRLYDYSSAATSRGWLPNGVSVVRRRVKRFVKQTPLIWRLTCRVRSVLGPFWAAE